LENYGKREIVEVIDMSEFVASQRNSIGHWRDGSLLTPEEHVYIPADPVVKVRAGIEA
jgi:hypothetical protein